MKTNLKERRKNIDQDQKVGNDPTQGNTGVNNPKAENGPKKGRGQDQEIVIKGLDLKIVEGLTLEIVKDLSPGIIRDQENGLHHVTGDTEELIADQEADHREEEDQESEKDVQDLHQKVIISLVTIELWMSRKDLLEDWKELKNSLKLNINSMEKAQKMDLTSTWQLMKLRPRPNRLH